MKEKRKQHEVGSCFMRLILNFFHSQVSEVHMCKFDPGSLQRSYARS